MTLTRHISKVKKQFNKFLPDDCTWLNGGCLMFARLLQKELGGEVLVLCSKDLDCKDYPVEHCILKVKQAYIDASGSYNRQELLNKYSKALCSTNSSLIDPFKPL
jgi:hypothetical protein